MTAGTLFAMTEREWQEQVTDLATLTGWSWAHWRPAMTSRGWRTPCSGPIAAGFVDLVLVRPAPRAGLLFVELKSDKGALRPEQRSVHDVLRSAGLTVHVWRPRDWAAVVEALR